MVNSNNRSSDASVHRHFSEIANVPQPGLVRELRAFLKSTRKWWLVPVFMALAVAALLIILGGTAAAPFIYTLF